MKLWFRALNRNVVKWRHRFQSVTSPSLPEAQPLRLELFSLDQLERHAGEVAEKHHVGSGRSQDRLLLRLSENERVLLQSYEHLSLAVQSDQRISPAGEWLLDNFHIIEEEIRTARRHLPISYSRELPHLTNTASVGFPRVYDIALEVIAHVDGRIDKENITRFVAAYQKITPLKLGEFWAIPIMLRLALIENLRRVASRVVVALIDRKIAKEWAEKLLLCAERDPKNLILISADMARSQPPMSCAFVAEIERRLQGQGLVADIPLSWIEHQLVDLGQTTEQTVQMENQQQAANQVSVSASIASLRFLGAMNWREFVESMNAVDRELLLDPAGIYGKMAFLTRDRYRHVVESLAKQTSKSESEVAELAIALASAQTSVGERLSHVGYYLIDKGLAQLEQGVGRRSFWPQANSQNGYRLRFLLHFGSILLLTLGITAFIMEHVAHANRLSSGSSLFTLVALLTFLSASQVALALVNWVTMICVRPHLLPQLDFSGGIPFEYRSLIAIPTLLLNHENVETLLDGLEIRYVANRDENLSFALLTDFADAKSETLPLDETLVQLARTGIEKLNVKYRTKKDVFFLFHRKREWNPREKIWMGFERKRGKLEALNALLRSSSETSSPSPFSLVVGNISTLIGVKYVITLDTDSQLPRDAAQKLVGTMAHPLNHPVYDSSLGRVTEGYSILQPRVAVSLPGSRRSFFARLCAGESGIDPYTNAVSDVYQDLFGEGSFVGKGIYDVDGFTQALSGKLPLNLILSHDLLEGCYARCGLVSDVVLHEEFPLLYRDDIRRRHRWIRGDWQISRWLIRKSPISILSKWKILDNLRRSVVPIAILLLLLISWLTLPDQRPPWFLLRAVLAMIFLPPLLTSLAGAVRKSEDTSLRPHLVGAARSSLRHLAQAALTVVFLPYEAFVSFDAIWRSNIRMWITRRKLLEWKSSSTAKNSARQRLSERFFSMAFPSLLTVGLTIALVPKLQWGHHWPILPFLALWLFSPVIAYWISRFIPETATKLTPMDIDFLHRLSRKTWRFFEVFVGPEDNWLPPDNFQEFPIAVIAHRTSPTNMGLSLLSNLSAYDFGYLSQAELVDRTTKALQTMERMERFRGHFYNWYDTISLEPLTPMFVSTVDSGNLAGLLFTLRTGLRELPDHKIIRTQTFAGLRDTLSVLVEGAKSKELYQPFFEELQTTPGTLKEINNFRQRLTTRLGDSPLPEEEEERWWFLRFRRQFETAFNEGLPFLESWSLLSLPPDNFSPTPESSPSDAPGKLRKLLREIENIPTLRMAAKLEQTLLPLMDELLKGPMETAWLEQLSRIVKEMSDRATEQMQAIEKLAQQCEDLATVEYDFLYDKMRHLFSIGYNVSERRRDPGFYDLLASEARLCSFLAIAQGSVSQEHWFALGRLLTSVDNHSTLLSWSGSMFEYLMPLLIMPTFENTLLDQTYLTAVRRQIDYGEERGVPWGTSESGCNARDVHLNYQYRAFGVPGLGLKRGLAADLVIAPYASVLSLMVLPDEATENLQRMKEAGYEGRYGFFEAVDFTLTRVPANESYSIVRSFMAHHQGMSLLSLAYCLLDRKMQKRFLSDPLFKATELLLHERVPKIANIYPHAPEVSTTYRPVGEGEVNLRVIDTPHTPRPEVHLLSNGRYSVAITNAGGGYSRWKDIALTRWREDPTCDNWGTFCYLRDVTSGETWSAAHQPSLKEADHYEAIFPQSKAEFRRRDNLIETHTEISVSPEDDIEIRRFTITNISSEKRTLELTSYAEVVLAPQAADEVHPAFSNLFVQTEIVAAKNAILCTRRPRFENEKTPVLLHLMTVHGEVVGETSYETDRAQFVGRGGSLAEPIAMEEALSGQEGSVLDPIVAIRNRVSIEPEETIRVHFALGIAETREAALSLVEKYRDRYRADRVFDLAWTHRQVVLRQLNINENDAHLYARLASSILYANPLRRAGASTLIRNRRGQSGLWGYGISGDLPIVLLRISTNEKRDIIRQLVQAHGYWRTMGLAVDLVIWNEDDSGYRQVLQDEILSLIAAGVDTHQMERPGGIFVRRADQMSEEDRILLQTVARAILLDGGGSLADQVERRGRSLALVAPFVPTRPRLKEEVQNSNTPPLVTPPLIFPNGMGGFSSDGREYLITTSPTQRTPAPWSNVIANPYFGTVVSESGSAYTWCENAHEFRLTPWKNDALLDSGGEAFYIRDEETGEFWSPTPLPARASSPYLTRHGFGYSLFELSHLGIHSNLTTFVANDAPVKMTLVNVRNLSQRTRRLSLTGYCEWVLGELRAKSLMHVVSETDPTTAALFVRNPYHPEFGRRIGFFYVNDPKQTFTCDRSEFLGRNGQMSNPAALQKWQLSGRVGAALDACSAVQSSFELEPGEGHELVFILGMSRDVDDARTLIRRFGTPPSARLALTAVKQHWDRAVGAVQIKTPDPSMNILANGWLLYQVLACRLWARSGYYQSGGAFGFRDQLQDAMALIHSEPHVLREHLLRCAGRQFREGDVQHWWHPPSGRGVRARFSDDYLWLPLAASRYVLSVGDTGVLNKRIHFIEGRQVNLDEEAYSDLPTRSDESVTLYEHCVRSIKYGPKYGQHGLPLMGGGDWNDGMNLVGEKGKGESVWLAFFLFEVLKQFSQVAKIQGDTSFADTCLKQASQLQENIETAGWDGNWYRRAYFDDGDPLGSAANLECQIDSIPQSWAVLTGAAGRDRARIAMESVNNRLVDRTSGLIKLFDPPFDKTEKNPGYIKGYVPGVRENGGQYTHGAIWTAMAFAALGDKTRAWELFTMINPVNHGNSAEKMAIYRVEPYVVAADVYAVPPHVGRGGWTWYTGSAGWMYRLIVESLLGLRLEVDKLFFSPCVPEEWNEFQIRYRFRETFYDITLKPAREKGPRQQMVLDGVPQTGEALLLIDDGRTHSVEVYFAHSII